jgi:hypothetical protein
MTGRSGLSIFTAQIKVKEAPAVGLGDLSGGNISMAKIFMANPQLKTNG